MSVSRRKDAGPVLEAPPPPRARRGAWGIWIGVGLIALLAVALFGFLLTPGELVEDDVADEAVLIDDGGLGD